MKIGIIGCGNISDQYFEGGALASNLEVKACADIKPEAAQAKAEQYGVQAMSVDALLADPEIKIVINLTIPRVHVEVGLKILNAGKHIYAEKPLAVNVAEGKTLLDRAEELGLRVGSAPDTFLFGGAQTARKVVDEAWIGRITSGTATFSSPGHEQWHPSPAFFYDQGGGPVYDMGPYYVTGLVNLLGPAKSVIAMTNRSHEERTARHDSIRGQKIPVHIDTHCTGVIEFANRVLINFLFSFDIQRNVAAPSGIFLQGTEGSLVVGDPNNHKNPVQLYRLGNDTKLFEIPFTHGKNARMIGVVDMVDAIRNARPHRASGELALHALEIMDAVYLSAKSGESVTLQTTCKRPAALPTGLQEWTV